MKGGALGRFGHFVLAFFALASGICALVFLSRNLKSEPKWCYGSAMFGFFVFTAGSYCLGWMWNVAANFARRGGQMRNLFLVQTVVIGGASAVAIPSPTVWQSVGYALFSVGLWALILSLTLARFPSQVQLPSGLAPLTLYFCTFVSVLVLMSSPPMVVTAGDLTVQTEQPFRVRIANVPWNNKWCGVHAESVDVDHTELTTAKVNGTWWVSGTAPDAPTTLYVKLRVDCCEHVNIVGKGFRVVVVTSKPESSGDPSDGVDIAKRSPAMSADLESTILSVWTAVLISMGTALLRFAYGWATVEYQRV